MKVIEIAQNARVEEPAAAAKLDLVAGEHFVALVNRHSRFVFRVAYAVLRNSHDAEDVVQETFLKLYRSGRWYQLDNERAFLARVAWRSAISRVPKRAAEIHELEMAAKDENPEQALISADRNALVARLIDALPEDLRRPLALSTVEEMTSQQIAILMEIPEATVRGRLMRARQILKEKLAAYAR